MNYEIICLFKFLRPRRILSSISRLFGQVFGQHSLPGVRVYDGFLGPYQLLVHGLQFGVGDGDACQLHTGSCIHLEEESNTIKPVHNCQHFVSASKKNVITQ